MNIRGKEKDIVNICLGHEVEDFACGFIMKHMGDDEPPSNILAYTEGFERGIKFLANYLKEYDIQIEIRDELVQTTDKEDWYSGEVVEY